MSGPAVAAISIVAVIGVLVPGFDGPDTNCGTRQFANGEGGRATVRHHVGTIALLLGAIVVLQGCVSITDPQNYRLVTQVRDQVYYDCYREAQLPQASASRAYASANYELNTDMLERCMGGKWYNLRKPTIGETVFGLVTSPVWFPIGLFTGIKPFKLGGGSGKD